MQRSSRARGALYAAVAMSSLMLEFNAHGSTFTWNKTTGGTWSVAANWTPNAPPSTSDTAFFNLNASYTVSLIASASVATLSVGTTSSGTVTFNAGGHALTFGSARFLTGATIGTVNFNNGTLNQTGIVNNLDVEDNLNIGTGAFLGNLNSLAVGTLNSASVNLSAASLQINSLGFSEPDNVIGANSHAGSMQLDFSSVGTINNATDVGQTNGTGFIGVYDSSRLTLQNLSIGAQATNFSEVQVTGTSPGMITQTGSSSLTIGGTTVEPIADYQGALRIDNGTFITGSGAITLNPSGYIAVSSASVLQINGNLAATGYIGNDGSITAPTSTIQINGTSIGTNPDDDPISIPTLENFANISGGTLIVGATNSSQGWARTYGGTDSATFTTTIVGALGLGTLDIGDDGSIDESTPTTGNFHTASLMMAQSGSAVAFVNVFGNLTAGSATIGELGFANLSLNGQGSITFTGPVVVADGSISTGGVFIFGTNPNAQAVFSDPGQLMTVGNGGYGILSIGDYSVVNIGTLQIGSMAGSSGNASQSGASLDTSVTASAIHIGSSLGGVGTYSIFGGTLTSGSIDITANGTFIANGGVVNAPIGVNGGTFIYNGGTINSTVTLNGGTLALSAPFASSPTLTVNYEANATITVNGSPLSPFNGAGLGIFSGAGTLNNFNTLSGTGTLLASQTLNNNGTFSSANGDFIVAAGATLSNGSLGLLSNSPASTLRVLTTNFTNLGNLQVNADGAVQLATSLTIPAGKSLSMIGGLFTNGASLTIANGGSLTGFGQIDSNLTNHGTTTFAGSMNVLGNLTNDGAITARDATSIIYGSVSNTGSITVQNGTIVFETPPIGGAVATGGLDGAGVANVGVGGQMVASYVRQNSLSITGTSLIPAGTSIRPTSAGGAFSRLSSLTITNGEMDLADTSLIVDYTNPAASPLTTLRGYLQTGRGNGNWQGAGLTSSLAAAVAADNSNIHKTALGFGEASALNITNFLGQSVDATTVLVRYTWLGDANLDGSVNSSDFALLAANYGKTGQTWINGDYNYDGTVNALDFNALATNYGQSLSADIPDSALPFDSTLVPEPAVVMIPVLLALNVRRRKFAKKMCAWTKSS